MLVDDVSSEDRSGKWIGGALGAQQEALLRFVRQLSVKLKAGLSPDKCLAALATETRHRGLRDACVAMHGAVAKGSPLAAAMREHGRFFDACVVGLVEWGERARKLRVALASVADYLEHKGRLEVALHGAVVRPLDALSFVLLAIFIATVVLSFLAHEVLPVAASGQTVAATTADRIAVAVAEFVREAWPFVGAFGLLCFLALRLLPRHPGTATALYASALRLPWLGPALRANAVAIFCLTVGIRMRAGNTLGQAMDIAARTAGNPRVRQRIATTMRKIDRGRPYIDVLVEDGFLRLGDVTAVQAAERRGELGALMLTLAEDREREALADARSLKTLVDTLVVLLIGVAILGVVLTLYVPVFVAH